MDKCIYCGKGIDQDVDDMAVEMSGKGKMHSWCHKRYRDDCLAQVYCAFLQKQKGVWESTGSTGKELLHCDTEKLAWWDRDILIIDRSWASDDLYHLAIAQGFMPDYSKGEDLVYMILIPLDKEND